MGEVYRARDTRLQRTVAIKILPESFSSDSDRLERFQQEARVLSALNHPNLMAIYDVGTQDGLHFLVSEFLDGESLRDVIATGPLPQRRVSEYGLQIARGLAAAHNKGIIHRDLKPDNVFVLRDERVKILDFGLAKQVEAVASFAGDSATMTRADRTSAGTVLGTAGYMSPEQVRGEVLDHRSDIFSFGAILYEMAGGKRAFQGDSGVEVMHSILKEEPPSLEESGLQVSGGMQRIVQRCLEKKPEARFQSASDLAFALDSLSSAGTATAGLHALKGEGKARSRALIPAALIAVLLIALAAAWWLLRPQTAPVTFTQISSRSQYIRNARLAPDGRTIVYGAVGNNGETELFSNRTDTHEQRSLGISGEALSVSSAGELAVALSPVFDPLWTPTGRLARVPLGGGATRELLDGVVDADWAPDGSALAVSRRFASRCRLEFPAGKTLYENDGYISDLRFSPGGDKIAFIDHGIFGDDRGFIDVIDLNGQRKTLTSEFTSAQGLAWSPKGDEIWFTAQVASEPSTLRAVDLRGRQRVLLPSAVRLHLQDVGKDGAVLLSTEDFRWQTFLADTGGATRDLTLFQWQYPNAISRDGRIVLFNTFSISADGTYELFIQHTNELSPIKIGQGAGMGFSRDSKWAVSLNPAHTDQIFVIPTGVGESRTIHAPQPLHYVAATWMPDGNHLLMVATAPGSAPATYVQDLATGAIRQVSPSEKYVPSNASVPVGVSPDGKYCVTTDGEKRYWIQPTDGTAAREIPGLLEGDHPLEWHNDSAHFFVARQNRLDGEIYDLNLANGQRKIFTKYSVSDKNGAIAVIYVYITPDGAHYAYVVPHIYSTLFVAKGIR